MQSVIRKTEHTFKKYGVTVRAKFNKIRNGSGLESCEQDNECSGSMKGRQVHSSPAERDCQILMMDSFIQNQTPMMFL